MGKDRAYYLSPTTRIMIIVPSIGVLLLSLWLFSLSKSSVGFTPLIIFCGLLAGFAIYCCINSFSSRLVITPNGITIHRFIPFHRFISWNKIERVVLDPLSEVDLICASDKYQERKQIVSITAFNADWSNTDFLDTVRKNAPHVEVSAELLNFRKPPFLYRSGTLLIYYVLVMPLGFFLSFLLPDIYMRFQRVFGQAFIGVVYSSLGGIVGLLVYGSWVNIQAEQSLIKRVTTIFYLVPWSGFTLVFLASLIFDIVSGHQRLPGFIVVVFGLVQLEIMLRIIGMSLKKMLLMLDKK